MANSERHELAGNLGGIGEYNVSDAQQTSAMSADWMSAPRADRD